MEDAIPVLGFSGYVVDKSGVVFGKRGTPLRPGGIERPIVILYREGRTCARQVSRLVLEAFVGPAPFVGACALHKNDDPWDNRLINLRWGTRKENVADFMRNTGRTPGKLRRLRAVSDDDLFDGTCRAAGRRFGCWHTVVSAERRFRRG